MSDQNSNKKIVLITGGSGLVGSRLSEILVSSNYEVRHLSRNPKPDVPYPTFKWDLKSGEIDSDSLNGVNYIIHLAGANVSEKRWTNTRKKEILQSRTEPVRLLISKVKELNIELEGFLAASATGIYGSVTTDQIFTENSEYHSDFLAEVCQKWEKSSLEFKKSGYRTVILRTGVVLSNKGGALVKMAAPVKFFMSTVLGSGEQIIPWIHIDDLCMMYKYALENVRTEGVFNAVSSDFQTNKSFTKQLCQLLNRPFWKIKLPAIVMKLIFGEMAIILLEGSKVSAEKIKKEGYEFAYSDLKTALSNLLK